MDEVGGAVERIDDPLETVIRKVFKTKDGKWNAVVKEIEARHEPGQPVLVGTISVEVSELLGAQLTKRGIKHTVLNAKPEYAEREGETIAEAGAPGAVTIATNMAGRGVDIKLGGNEEHLARLEVAKLGLQPGMPDYDEHVEQVLPAIRERIEEQRQEVLDAGGLFILGTERHESRRIDNQLRGRAGRQGDPGESRFFLSAEDDLVRLFAGERIYKILDRLGTVDEEGNEEPIEAGMLSKQIEKAQRKVEEQHYLARKHTLEYDDVLNQQREVDLRLPRRGARGPRHLRERARAAGQAGRAAGRRVLRRRLRRGLGRRRPDARGCWRSSSRATSCWTSTRVDREDLALRLQEEALAQYDQREQEFGEELMREVERYLLLEIIDQHWQEHLYDMDYLQQGIHLRGAAQIEPLVAYKNEAFTLFEDLMNNVWSDFARFIFHVEVTLQADGRPAGGAAALDAEPRLELGDRRRSGQLLGRRAVRIGGRARRRGRGRAVSGRGAAGGYEGAEEQGAAVGRSSSGGSTRPSSRPQRPVLVRLGQEVQEVPRRLSAGAAALPCFV